MKLASFEAIVRSLNAAGVRYLIAGGLAVNAHGYLMKEAVGREQDRIDNEHLRMLLEDDAHE